MNKKTVSLILFVCCLSLIIIISVLGKAPDSSTKVSVDSIQFIDSRNENGLCKVNDEDKKIIELPKDTKTYQLEYVINPKEATEKDVYFFIMGDSSIATVDAHGFVTFHKEMSITIKIVSNFTDNKMDFVIIEFTGTKGEDIEDNPFA